MSRSSSLLYVASLVLAVTSGCGRLEEHVRHADVAYREARYGDAEEWLERVEADVGELDDDAQTRFYFVRGMTAYRLDHRDEALHYLVLARETSAQRDGSLAEEDAAQLERALAELLPTTADHHARPAPTDGSSVTAPE